MSKPAKPAGVYPATLDEWSHDRFLIGLELGAIGGGPPRIVDFELPNLQTFAMRSDIPNPLAQIALRSEWDPKFSVVKSEDDNDRKTYYELMCWVIGTHLKRPDVLTECGGEPAAAAAWVMENLHRDHIIALWQRCQHIFDDADVLAAMREIASEIERLEGEEVKGSDVKSVTDLAGFRDGGDGPAEPRRRKAAKKGA